MCRRPRPGQSPAPMPPSPTNPPPLLQPLLPPLQLPIPARSSRNNTRHPYHNHHNHHQHNLHPNKAMLIPSLWRKNVIFMANKQFVISTIQTLSEMRNGTYLVGFSAVLIQQNTFKNNIAFCFVTELVLWRLTLPCQVTAALPL